MTDTTVSKAPVITSSRLILWGTVAGSVALSIVSAYETWLGLNDFMPKEIIGGIMAFILTFGVQVILFAISWSIAEHVRDGFKSNIWRIAIWVMCAFFSGYFSFYGFFQGTGGRAEPKRTAYVQTQQDEMLASIDANLIAELEERHQTDLMETSQYEGWVEQLESLITIANSAQDDIAANNAQESAKLREAQRQLRDERDALTNDRAAVEAQARQGQRELRDLRAHDEALRARGTELRNSLLRLEGERDALQVLYDEETVTGVGDRARAIELNLNSKRAEVAATRQLIEANTEDLRDLQSDLATAEIASEDGVAGRRRNELNTQIEQAKDRIAAIDLRLATLSQGVSFDLKGQTATLSKLKTDLAGRDYDAFGKLVAQCAFLKQQLADSNVGQNTASVECSDTEILSTVDTLTSLQMAVDSFRAECLDNRPLIETREGSKASILDPTIAHMQKCALSEPDRATREDLRAFTASLITDRGDTAEPIRQASVALFRDRQANAVLSFIFAAIVDLLVLLCALVGKNIGLPQNVRAIDKLISMIRKPSDLTSTAEAVIPLPDDPRLMDLIDPIVNRLIREGYAEFDGAEFGGADQLTLTKGSRHYLARLRGMEISEQAVSGGIKRDMDSTHNVNSKNRGRRRPKEPI